ncbi:DNA polymerase subunit beta [Methanocalculus chunghsingensis]|uniref:DNA polymerase subunit beta n=1 Tax=Methanocalculus chunghsingensis TaxID=156457 RepID=A0A8J7W7G6_9EURY|nr:nucleotidyltransferase domain-containing protein [Methanocalculus chunghsingensis]MBR1368010.1 DNA polymerase subunit beta [Methanocalculus chunghsingensis]
MRVTKPIRLRDFVATEDGAIYSVAVYDNETHAGCILRYLPDPEGERRGPDGVRYRKVEFEDAYTWIRNNRPEWADTVHRIPLSEIARVFKPEEMMAAMQERIPRLQRLMNLFPLPEGTVGCTGSLLCGLENEASDIDLVVYGDHWFSAQRQLQEAVAAGRIPPMSMEMWQKVYTKRVPEISFDEFVTHEERKFNRGEYEGTYFDLLYTRAYENLNQVRIRKGEPVGRGVIEAVVTDASLSFDSPAIYAVDHDEIAYVLSFTHTYSGQARDGEVIEAAGVIEEHGDERWLVVGTTREARGEYIISKTLLKR